jgi:hypothetical protein
MDSVARSEIERIEKFRSLDAVERYLEQQQALDEDELTRLIEDGSDAFD